MRTWQKLSRQSSQDELASDDNFLLDESPREKVNSTIKSNRISPIKNHGVSQHSHTSNAKGKLKKVLNVYKGNISVAYNVSDIEIDEPSPVYDRDTTDEVRSLTDCMLLKRRH